MFSSVLITGGTGTLGQELVRQLLALDCERICIYSRDEYKQYEMREAISDPKKRLRFFIGDVRDLKRLRRAFAGVEHVIHAAALKQIDAMEFNPLEAVRTNIGGTENVIEAALDTNVERVLLVSTDKAEAPTTLYGATKLCAERLVIASNKYAGSSEGLFNVVRFGNIMGSRGSVLPKWKAMIAAGATKVPVTDPDCTRYWITADEAATRALHALVSNCVLYMPMMHAFRVGDLAEALGVEMDVIGLRPGERLHEAESDSAPRLTIKELRTLVG